MSVSQLILIGYQLNMGHLKAFCMPNHLGITCTGDQVGNNPYVLFPTGASVMPVNYFLPDPVGIKTPPEKERGQVGRNEEDGKGGRI